MLKFNVNRKVIHALIVTSCTFTIVSCGAFIAALILVFTNEREMNATEEETISKRLFAVQNKAKELMGKKKADLEPEVKFD